MRLISTRNGFTRREAITATLATGMAGFAVLAAETRASTNVRDLGAAGDGSTDDTAAIERAFSRGGAIYFPSGTYCYAPASSTGFMSNTEIFGEGTSSVIKYTPLIDPVTTSIQQILRPRAYANVDNVTIRDIVLDGNRDGVNWAGVTGDGAAFGLALWGTQNVFVDNLTVRNAWTDGLYLAASHSSQFMRRQCENIRMGTVYAQNCGRQGMSIISAKGVTIGSLIVNGVDRTSPRSALDLEPDNARLDHIENITIGVVEARGTGAGVLISGVSIIENVAIGRIYISDVRQTYGVFIRRAKNVSLGEVVIGMANAVYPAFYANEYDTFHIGSLIGALDNSVRTGGQGGILIGTPPPTAELKNRNGRIDRINLNGARGDGVHCASGELSVGYARIANANRAANGSKAFVLGPKCKIAISAGE